MPQSIVFKPQTARFTSVLISAKNPAEIHRQLAEKLTHAPAEFFRAVPMVADLKTLSDADELWLHALKQAFHQQGLLLIGLSHHPFSTAQLAQAGLADIAVYETRAGAVNTPQVQEITSTTATQTPHSPAPAIESRNTVIRQPIRSGQRVYARGGDLTVIGTVGAGAEVIADGNIHILGTLRGRAFAGAQGDEDAHIFCHALSAELVSIAGSYQNMEQLEAYNASRNCLITLDKDETMRILSL